MLNGSQPPNSGWIPGQYVATCTLPYEGTYSPGTSSTDLDQLTSPQSSLHARTPSAVGRFSYQLQISGDPSTVAC